MHSEPTAAAETWQVYDLEPREGEPDEKTNIVELGSWEEARDELLRRSKEPRQRNAPRFGTCGYRRIR